MHPFTLERPRDLAAALAFQAQAGRTDAAAEYIAGGTDMVQLLQEEVRQPTRLVSLNASASYTDAVYIDYPNAPQAPERLDLGSVQSLSGKPLAGVPKFTYTLGADIAQPVGRIAGQTLQFYGHADFAHRSSLNTSSTNSRYAQVPGYGVLNGRIGVRPESGRWDLSVWARNLTNTKYFQTLAAANTGVITALLGDPRTVGATLRIKL